MPNYSTTPTASQILRRCRHLSSVNQNQKATDLFAGTEVCWSVRFSQAEDLGFAGMQFCFTQRGLHLPGPLGDGLIYVHASPSAFPEMQNPRRSQRLVLSGRVTNVDEYLGVTLDLDTADVKPWTAFDRVVNFFQGNTG